MAGVDYIEHRVILNGVPGPWVRSTNPGLVNPYTSSVTVSELGAYSIEYRSADRGGNAEADQDGDVLDQPPDDRRRARSARSCPSTLGLAVNPLVLGPFIPGVAQTYTGTTTATVTSSWPNATLSVYDEDANTNTNGRLVNGASIIPRGMDVLNSPAPTRHPATRPARVRSRPGRHRWPAPVGARSRCVR